MQVLAFFVLAPQSAMRLCARRPRLFFSSGAEIGGVEGGSDKGAGGLAGP